MFVVACEMIYKIILKALHGLIFYLQVVAVVRLMAVQFVCVILYTSNCLCFNVWDYVIAHLLVKQHKLPF